MVETNNICESYLFPVYLTIHGIHSVEIVECIRLKHDIIFTIRMRGRKLSITTKLYTHIQLQSVARENKTRIIQHFAFSSLHS